MSWHRHALDPQAVRARVAGRCFICELLAGNPDFSHRVIFENEDVVAFLNAYPTLYAHSLVAPKKHLENVTADLDLGEYLGLQTVVYRVAEAIRRVVDTERLYLLSLGSRQGNAHVHWHVAPLPPGVQFEEQQLAALDWSRGVLDIPSDEAESLADSLRREIARG